MRHHPSLQNIVWTVLFSLLTALTLNACGDSNNVSTPNGAPTANAGPDLGSIRTGTIVTLNGSASSDPNGDPLTYRWTFVSIPAGSAAAIANPTSVSPTFTVDRAGDYIAQLTVNDGQTDSAPDTVLITTNNVPPVANAGPDLGNIAPGTRITLNGRSSADADGDPLTYAWTFVSKPAGSAAALANPTTVSPAFTVDHAGDYIVQLIVNDGTVNSAADRVLISTDNVAPVANAGPDQGRAAPGSTIALDGSGSSDANGDPLTYSWSFQSKPTGSAAVLSNPTIVSPTFVVDRDGDYVVQLIVSDGTVNSVPNSVTITSDNVAPVADAGPVQTVAVSALVILAGSASSDANGDPLTYSWTFVSIPVGSLAVLAGSTTVSPTFTADLAGNYVVQLIVHDGTVDSAPDSVIITTN